MIMVTTLENVLADHAEAVEEFQAGKDMDDELYQALFDIWVNDMPYGTAKARSGDPYVWVSKRLHEVLLDNG